MGVSAGVGERGRLGSLGIIVLVALGPIAVLPACGSSPSSPAFHGTSGDAAAGAGGKPATGGSTAAGMCSPGDTRPCVGPGQCPGGQACAVTGRWESCDCGSVGPAMDGGSRGGAGGTTGAGGGAPQSGAGGKSILGAGGVPPLGTGGNAGLGGAASTGAAIGRACAADADCGARGVFCLTASSKQLEGGGAANGICVVDCTTATTACAAVDPTSVCVAFSGSSGPAHCIEGCVIGPSSALAPKCHGRPDVACDDAGGAGTGDGICRPMCRGDFECAGRACDFTTGFCVDPGVLVGKLPIGSLCDPSAVTDLCAGLCLPIDSARTRGLCAGFCSLGSVGCGDDPASTAPLHTECLFDATTIGGADYGDIGFCSALCDCDAQCPAATSCRPFTTPAEKASTGRAGYCAVAKDAQGTVNPHVASCP